MQNLISYSSWQYWSLLHNHRWKWYLSKKNNIVSLQKWMLQLCWTRMGGKLWKLWRSSWLQAWNGESGNELCRCCWLVLNFLKLVKNLSYAWLMNDMFNICNKWHIFDLPPIYYIDPKYDMFTYVNSLQFITTRKLTISERVSTPYLSELL